MQISRPKQFLTLVVVLLLTACASKQPTRVVYRGPPPVEPVPEEVDSFEETEAFRRSRILADMLYEAKVAYEDNRLMSPSGNNAFDHYREVLQLDPGNQVALEGIEEIVLRYIDLADVAMRQSKYDEARSMLDRAERLNPIRPELEGARQRLELARRTKVSTFALDAGGLRSQSLDAMNELAEIAQYIQRNEAVFLINARTDEEGRWIYKVMREAVGGYRLRGNIDISGTPGILVTIPAN